MKYKKTQLAMVWLLPLIVIGGLFNPLLGYLVIAMIAYLLSLSYFKGRYWCWNLCPRGAFLDLIMAGFSRNKSAPRFFSYSWFRWLIVIVFMSFLIWRLNQVGANLPGIGLVFVLICLFSTLAAIVLAILSKHRSWCMICPMGTLQQKIGSIRKKR